MTTLGFHSFAEANVYVTFVLLGMSIVMVLGAMLSAPAFIASYYIYATGKPDAVCEKPYFWDNALTFFFAIMFAVQFICEALTLTPFVRRIPLRLRLIVGLCIPFIEMFILEIVPVIKISSQDGAIAVIVVVGIVSGFSKALCDSTTNAIVGPFPTKFMNGAQWGLTISPLMMSVVEMILKGSFSDSFSDTLKKSRIYLGIGMLFQFLALVEMLILDKNPFAQKYNAEFRFRALQRSNANVDNQPDSGNADETTDLIHSGAPRLGSDHRADGAQPNEGMNVVAEGNLVANEAKGDSQVERMNADLNKSSSLNFENDSHHKHHSANAAILRATGDADKMVDVDQVNNVTSSDQMLKVSAMSVIKRVWPMLFCTFFIYFISLLLFPGLFLKVAINTNDWYSTLVVFLYNLGDFLSRILLMYRPFRPSPKVVLAGSIVRLVIIPLLVLCAKHTIKGYALPYVLSIVLSLTNGYFGTMACMYSPRTPTLSKAGERSLAGILSGLFLMLGLCTGSNLAVLVNLVI
ncbi:unnamed protein product [Phytomonas sp. EM1]|nr:unnamed protein product [Phytomonas sp. EM1]|eukprot:CCW60056.1 unnamed protein product [Phytomonas sp. isolate EM1]